MPSEAPLHGTQTEKPQHYMYLKEFRTQQCPLFVQHKCTQHRPYTCFHWHFLNQRRRRPVKRRDGTFSYSPDIYCSKYDEGTGICPDGDDCPYLHRTAGDTERRYHLRYYKTGTCVYETDSRGNCVKNGAHCAFAHGASDLRPPVFDKSDVQGLEILEQSQEPCVLSTATPSSSSTSTPMEKDKMSAEDPIWNETNFVLANYKTEPCKRPPRLCRQGFACPYFHNVRDRRRTPKLFKYRSTPCPNVKHGDDWCDPNQCENGDGCTYCHTRTEQQFHPEIYKSTKCNDKVQTGKCPRGAYCAFAHIDHEMTSHRERLATTENSLAAFVTSALPSSSSDEGSNQLTDTQMDKDQNDKTPQGKLPDPIGKERANSGNSSSGFVSQGLGSFDFNKGRSGSVSSSIGSDFGSGHSYHKAPGSEREENHVRLRQHLHSIENDPSLDNAEKARQKEALILQHSFGHSGLLGNLGSRPVYSPIPMPIPIGQNQAQNNNSLGLGMSSMSPHAPAFYPPGNTVESVVGKAIDDLTVADFDINTIDREMRQDSENNCASSNLAAGLVNSSAFPPSGPIGIPPGSLQQRHSLSSMSQSPPSPFGSLPQSHSNNLLQLHSRDTSHDSMTSGLSNQFFGNFPPNNHGFGDSGMPSPRTAGPQSPSLFHPMGQPPAIMPQSSMLPNTPRLQQASNSLPPNTATNGAPGEVQKLRDEVATLTTRLAEWEGVYSHARKACEAWRVEAEECSKKTKQAEDEKLQAVKQKDEALAEIQRLGQQDGPGNFRQYARCLPGPQEMEALSVETLQQLRNQIQLDLNLLDQVIFRKLQQRQVRSS